MKSQPRSQKRRKQNGSPLLWLMPSQAIALFTAWGIAAGEQALRVFMLGGMFLAMFVPLLVSLQAGLTAMVIFEPFRGFLRRAQYIFVPYSQTEPIHLLTPIVTIAAFFMVIFRHKLETIRLTPLAGWTTALAAICLAQVFNPLQGGLFIGFSGALFYLVPMAWFYFGQVVDRDFVPRILKMVVVLGLVASCYGVYQMVVGYPRFELYWIENTDFYNSIAVYDIQRALATFSSAEEWGRYIQVGGIIAFGLAMSRSEGGKRVLWGAAFAGLFLMLALTGQRTAIFGLFLGIFILFLTGARTFAGVGARVLLAVMPLVLMVALSKPMDEKAGFELDKDDKVGKMLSHTTKGTMNPTGEGSLEARFETWSILLTTTIPSNPVGYGLGATTLSAGRENEENSRPIDNHFMSMAVSAGVPAALILLIILVKATIFCLQGWRETEPDSEESDWWRIMLALSATFILNNFFGTSFGIYSIAPLGWLTLGWISAAYAELKNRQMEEWI